MGSRSCWVCLKGGCAVATYDNLIQVRDLKKYYDGENIKALDGVSVDINKGT